MSNKSYRRYRQYKSNQHQYKMDQIVLPIFMMLLIGLFTKFGYIIIPLLIIFIIAKITEFFNKKPGGQRKPEVTVQVNDIQLKEPPKAEPKEEPETKVVGAGDINMSTPKKLKSTEVGYINKNDQKNNGRSNEKGSDHGQWFYNLECLKCGHTYLANGTDIWQRKCPKCQGGRP